MSPKPDRSQRLLSLLRDSGALLEGHFLLSSGLHSERYFQCARLLQHPDLAAEVGGHLAEACRSFDAQVVAAPALGGIIVAHEVGRALSRRAIFAERVEGTLTFRRGFSIEPGEGVLVVEDVVTTGRSTMETVEAVERCGGRVAGLGAIVDRSGKLALPHPFRALLELPTPSFETGECPLCLAGEVPVTKPGSRKLPAS